MGAARSLARDTAADSLVVDEISARSHCRASAAGDSKIGRMPCWGSETLSEVIEHRAPKGIRMVIMVLSALPRQP